YPLGATWDGGGTNFAVFSEVAEAVELCLFGDPDDGGDGSASPGPTAPRSAGSGPTTPGSASPGPTTPPKASPRPTTPPHPPAPNTTDSAPYMPANVVINPFCDWGDDRPPRTPYHETVIYEAHVRGLTMRHPDLPPEERGTYAGLAHPAVIEHMTGLGVTAVE